MKLKALSLALLALPITSFATEPVSHQPTDVSFSVEAEKEVERDLLQVSLFYQAEGNDLSTLNKTMAEKMNKAIELAKAQSAVEIKDNSRNTWIRYDNKGKQQGWIARAELTLESKDSQVLSTHSFSYSRFLRAAFAAPKFFNQTSSTLTLLMFAQNTPLQ